MKKEELYTPEGWIDSGKILHSRYPFTVAIGGRGIGKTYGCLRDLFNERIPFIYLRRTQNQLDSITIDALNPYNQICRDYGYSITCEKMGKNAIGFYELVWDEETAKYIKGEPFALGIALSTFASIRGLSAERFKVLLFDEIIPEKHERPIKEEGIAFANLLESLNRNRELTGDDPLKVVLLSNSNTLNSQILSSLGILKAVERMERTGKVYEVIQNSVEIVRYIDSPISERKKNTALYKVVNSDEFKNMALNNEFAADNFEYVQTKPLKEFKPVSSIGNITVFKHRSQGYYYIIEGVHAPERYGVTDHEKTAWCKKYFYVLNALFKRKVIFSSAYVKIEFERMVLK